MALVLMAVAISEEALEDDDKDLADERDLADVDVDDDDKFCTECCLTTAVAAAAADEEELTDELKLLVGLCCGLL